MKIKKIYIWYYIFEDNFFEIYSVNLSNDEKKESGFIGYFGKNGLTKNKNEVKPLTSKRLNHFWRLKNTSNNTENEYYIFTNDAVYSINFDNYSISVISDLVKFNGEYYDFIAKKNRSEKGMKAYPGYKITANSKSNKLRVTNIFETKKNFEIEMPVSADNLFEMQLYLTNDDTFLIITKQNLDLNKYRFLFYKKEKNKEIEFIKTISYSNVEYWQEKFQNILFRQYGIKLYNEFILRYNNNDVTPTKHSIQRNRIFHKNYLINLFIGILLYFIIYFADMRKNKFNFSHKLKWFVIAIMCPYFYPFAYLCRDR